MSNSYQSIVINSPIGNLELKVSKGHLTYCYWTDKPVQTDTGNTTLLKALTQLQEYFEKKRTHFDLPLSPQGTAFQKAIWKQLESIPYGQTQSYQEIANAVGNSKAIRATGSANGKNPICIIIPCHRVIRSSGKLGGYSGGLVKKKHLLALEAGGLNYDETLMTYTRTTEQL